MHVNISKSGHFTQVNADNMICNEEFCITFKKECKIKALSLLRHLDPAVF